MLTLTPLKIVPPQKVLHLSKELEKKKPNLTGDFILTEKFDGWYTQLIYNTQTGWQVPLSSAGRPIPAFAWVAEYLNSTKLKPKRDCIILAEAIIPATPFHVLKGKFNRSVGDCACKDVVFKVHDLLEDRNYNSFARSSVASKFVYYARDWNNLTLFEEVEPLAITPYEPNLWQKTFETIINKGGEGIIAKRGSALYTPGKKSSDLMKLKLEATFDLLCTDVYWTVGEKGNDNMNLKLMRASGVELSVRVGKHSDITKFTEDSPIGKVVEVRCMQELPTGMLREPRFSWVREDKLINQID